jgi:leishmanolysin
MLFLVAFAQAIRNDALDQEIPFIHRRSSRSAGVLEHRCIHDEGTLQSILSHHGMDAASVQNYDDVPTQRREFKWMQANTSDSSNTSNVNVTDAATTDAPLWTTAPSTAQATNAPPTATQTREPPPVIEHQPIRITFSFTDLHDPAKYCNESGVTRPDFISSLVICTSAAIFTPEKAVILERYVLPEAARRIRQHLRVKPIVGNLSVPRSSACGPSFTIPGADVAQGVQDTDFRVYVAAGPTADGTLAWAGYCLLDQFGRPVVARANFNPQYVMWSETDMSKNEPLIRTAVHELTHALGFTKTFMQGSFPGGQSIIKSVAIRAKTTSAISTPNVLRVAREFFNCSNMSFVELEDEGGSGTAMSHWERRNLAEELMAGVSSGNKLSPLSLAFLEDSGHYNVSYAGAETMQWGNAMGCGFLESFCNTTAGGADVNFCFEMDQNVWQCNSDLTGIGPCMAGLGKTSQPAYRQYVPSEPMMESLMQLMDNCPAVVSYSNLDCDISQPENGVFVQLGHYFGPGGRCFGTTGLVATGASKACLRARCVDNTTLEIQTPDSNWHRCPTEGGDVTVDVFQSSATLTCPMARRVCISPLPQELFVPATPQPTTLLVTQAPWTTKAPTLQPTSLNPSTAAAVTTSAQTQITQSQFTPLPPPPTTARPAAATPLPAGFVAVAQCSVALNGTATRFRRMLQLKADAVQSALVRQLATLLSLSPSNIQLDGYMSSLTFDVTFRVIVGTSLLSQSSPLISSWNNLIRGSIATRSSISFSEVAALYASANNVTSGDVVPISGGCIAENSSPTGKVVSSGTVTLGGADFRTQLATSSLFSVWRAAVTNDIAAFLGLSPNSINITSLGATAASLRVSFDVLMLSSLSPPANFSQGLNATLSSMTAAPCREASALLGSGSVTLDAAAVDNPVAGPGSLPAAGDSWDDHCVVFRMTGCAYIQIGIAAAAIWALLFCIYMCLCSKKHPAVKKRKEVAAAAVSRDVPYHAGGVLRLPTKEEETHGEAFPAYPRTYPQVPPPPPPQRRVYRDEDFDDL